MAEGQFIIIEGWDVEFVPPTTPLVEEALERGVERDVNGVPTFVFTAEHLAAICLQVGRAKDHDRVMRFVDAEVLDEEMFEAILSRHGLMDKWHQFQNTYFSEADFSGAESALKAAIAQGTLSADQIESARDSLASAETAVAIAVASAAKEKRNAELAAINRAEEQQFCIHAILHSRKELPE